MSGEGSHDSNLLGQMIASVSFLRTDVHRMIERLGQGENRMDFLSEENLRRKFEIQAVADRLSASALARPVSPEPASSFLRLVSAFSDVATEWGETIKFWGRVSRWLLLAYLAFSLNRGEFVPFAKQVLTHDMEASTKD